MTFPFKSNKRSHSGDNGDEDPPVPIPNTEVKLVYAESTWHTAPGRIGNCRISIKNDRFWLEKRSFFFCFDLFSLCSICAVSARVDIKFWVNFYENYGKFRRTFRLSAAIQKLLNKAKSTPFFLKVEHKVEHKISKKTSRLRLLGSLEHKISKKTSRLRLLGSRRKGRYKYLPYLRARVLQRSLSQPPQLRTPDSGYRTSFANRTTCGWAKYR